MVRTNNMALSAAEKMRKYRERLKANSTKYEEKKKKDRDYYHRKKRLVAELTEREKRIKRRKGRAAQQRWRDKQKEMNRVITPPPSPAPSQASSPASLGRRRIRRDRSSLYRENLALIFKIRKLETNCEKYKKRWQREKQRSTVKKIKPKSKYSLLCNAVKDTYNKLNSPKDKRIVKKILLHKNIKNSNMTTAIVSDSLGLFGRVRVQSKPKKLSQLKVTVEMFFQRDDVSRATAGKKETVTFKKVKMQKRFLLDDMKSLYKQFRIEHPNICSYRTFVRYKPFIVVPPSVDGRDTCLCKIHANSQYKFLALKNRRVLAYPDISVLIKATVCDSDKASCMQSTCRRCKSSKIIFNETSFSGVAISWFEWVRKTEILIKEGKKMIVKKNIKEQCFGLVTELIDSLQSELKVFKQHVYNIRKQFQNYRKCIQEIQSNEAVLHIDFSENYSCEYNTEIQAFHFGGSRQQVTLHTGVLYLPSDDDTRKPWSFCTVSSSNQHNPPAIWAHLQPILSKIKSMNPNVNTIHFFSDGPSTQYRQKQKFFFTCTEIFDQGFEAVTWSFFEAGHGKGAADGIGGCLKRTADKLIANGKDIDTAEKFAELLSVKSKINIFKVTQLDIDKFTAKIPNDLVPLHGTQKVHQIFTNKKGLLQCRNLSCFCNLEGFDRGFCKCLSPASYYPVKIIQQLDDSLGDTYPPIRKKPQKSFYSLVYSSESDPEDNIPLKPIASKTINSIENPTISLSSEIKDCIHKNLILNGTFLMVRIFDTRKNEYSYASIAQGDVEDDGEVKVMFLKSVDENCNRFKPTTESAYVEFENIIEILPNPKIFFKARNTIYEFPRGLSIFEK